MQTLNERIEMARRGEPGHAAAILARLDAFEHIVLRGAGAFGAAFGAFLLGRGTPPEKLIYWDIRADKLKTKNGIPVEPPFSVILPAEKTLVINCIPNGSLAGSAECEESVAAGYRNHLSGMALFEALMCNMDVTTGFDAGVCLKTKSCNWCACRKLPSLLYRQQCAARAVNVEDDPLIFTVLTFVINQKCTLRCAHCGQYINHYGANARVNFPLSRIASDIDRIFDAVDATGFVSIIGGEPFLHPQLDSIVRHLLEKPNFGVIGVTTNGVCEMSDRHLAVLDNGRTRIIFSDYRVSLDEKQKRVFERNLEKVVASGIDYTVGQPLWATPPSLKRQDMATERKTSLKRNCHARETGIAIQNGVYYPCTAAAGVGSHRLADYAASDWIELDETSGAPDLRVRIQALEARPFYESCAHCGDGGEEIDKPGGQGIDPRYLHIGQR